MIFGKRTARYTTVIYLNLIVLRVLLILMKITELWIYYFTQLFNVNKTCIDCIYAEHLSIVISALYLIILTITLHKCNTGCVIGTTTTNHLMYADDLVIMFPYA